ncbi:hypothetical protein KI387_011802, partial [Taxus chinensis]
MPRMSSVAFVGDPSNIVPASSVDIDNMSCNSKAVDQHTKASMDETTATEKLFNSEDTTLAAASAVVMGLAEAAMKAVKDAAALVDESENYEGIPSEEDLVRHEQASLIKKEKPQVVKALDHFLSQPIGEESSSNVARHFDFLPAFVSEHISKESMQLGKRIARRASRLKAGGNTIEVAATDMSAQEAWEFKHAVACLMDSSNALHILRDSLNSKLLTATEEAELSKGIQDLLKLERIREKLAEKIGQEPTLKKWAQAVGTDHKTLCSRLLVGKYCKKKIFKSNLGLVKYVANRYNGLGLSSEDLFQEGCIGLVHGIERFDYTMGFRFSTYAHWWIRRAMTRALSNSSRIVRYPTSFYFDMVRVNLTKTHFYQVHGRCPRIEQLAKITGLSVEKLRLMKSHTRIRRSTFRNFGEDRMITFKDIVTYQDIESPEVLFIKQELREEIAKSLNTLSEREREILRLRYGFDDDRPKPLREIEKLLSLSRERVRQLQKSSLRKIRDSSCSL